MTNQATQAAAANRVSRIPVNDGQDYLSVTREALGRYKVLDFSGRVGFDDAYGFVIADCPQQAENRDMTSDSFTCFGISDSVQVGGCIFDLNNDVIEGPNLNELRQAARGLAVQGYDTAGF